MESADDLIAKIEQRKTDFYTIVEGMDEEVDKQD